MEQQRIGSSSKPLEGAGFDPAFIPGLTSPVTAEPEDEAPAEEAGAGGVRDEAVEDAGVDGGAAAAGTEETPSEEPDESSDGPVFEAADRRARIVADARGVRLRLDEEECEFRWDEIGAVETEVPRFGKRLTITVHTPDRRWYPIEIEATARSRFKEWDEQLDAVLDAYFEDGDEADTDAEDAADVRAGTDADTEAETKAEDDAKDAG
ncbi:hypothetical protein ACH4F6_11460 [Streptomyces sp. NPDC017936]|uniref:hypothetical protein n=1 Tax=Streptomyces sp. NPDC017936 TaxID=3365016 RepID=UPI0037930847